MVKNNRTGVIIPAHNEENSIEKVIKAIPSFVSEIVVISNQSTDRTAQVARKAGATVFEEVKKGYGYACLKGIDYFSNQTNPPGIIVFLDGDYSDYPEELPDVIAPIVEKDMDMVIGSRALGKREKGSMLPQQIFGNWLATTLMRIFFGARFTDLGPFRAIKLPVLLNMKMQDKTYGWTVEMQLKAAKSNIRFTEVPVRYRQRIGKSKVTGTIRGTIMAGIKIIFTIFKHLWK